MNFNIGDTVIYGADGVCRISEITKERIGTEFLKYIILKPLRDEKSAVFVPMKNEKLMKRIKPVITEEEILDAIEKAKAEDFEWIDDDSKRKEFFHTIFNDGGCKEFLLLMKSLYKHREKQIECGKNLHVSDERTLKETEKVVFNVVSNVIGITPSAASVFVKEQLNLI